MNNRLPKLRAVVLIAILVLVSLLLLRFILEFSQYADPSFIKSILLLPTEPLVLFFKSITIGTIEVSTIVAIIFLIVLAYLASKVITAFEHENEDTTGTEIIETILRSVEFLIIFRVILAFIGASGQGSPFAGIIYILTDWSSVLLQPLVFSFGRLDISALLMLLIVIVLDINTEIILRAVRVIKDGGERGGELLSRRNESSENYADSSSEESNSKTTNDIVDENPALQPTEIPTPTQNNTEENSEKAVSSSNASDEAQPKTKHIDDKAVPEG